MGIALQTFFSRSLSTLSLWGICAAVMYWAYEPGLWFLVGALVLGGLAEYFGMLQSAGLPHFRRTGFAVGTVIIVGALAVSALRGHAAALSFESAVLALGALLIFIRQILHRGMEASPLSAVGITFFGVAYVPFLAAHAAHLLYFTPRTADGHLTGHLYLLYLAVVTKMSDCGAYVTGSLIGRHPMIPRISPKKTWEGFVGAIGFSMLSSLLLRLALPDRLALIGTPMQALFLGAFLGLMAVLGDLAESLVKRSTGTKDSGSFLPGIGGALDLIDSLLFTAPILYWYLRCTSVS
jgi:phosphatidate cytidylyltransferase